ncbi:hypothetical protein Sango_0256500 [Sesamum angolense]|uniref:Aminotransferase-like plant mobile domain-containing protein n=1 Tax=Sesamum angolense TaxID=2727404 RepID=A0AAE1XH86_9LAMI|nr:hypothetical protein Sango_0256500 [Sesamum angolense]
MSSATSRDFGSGPKTSLTGASMLVVAQVYDFVYASLFTYDRNSDVIKAFYEAWCPSTNTLLTSFGELSISLWDLHTLVGLPMNGLMYDEVVPSAKELDGVDKMGRRFVRHSYKSLLHAYNLLQTNSNDEEALFSKLGIEGSLKEETLLVTCLACWLCTFTLPIDVGSKCPSTFKVVSTMAAERSFGLVVPVLASIYKGLNKISSSSRLIHVHSPFLVYFVYSWITHYFKTLSSFARCRWPKMTLCSSEGSAKYYDPQEARKWIHKGDFVSWTCNMIAKHKDFSFVDDGHAKEFEEFSSMPPNAKKFSSEAYKGWWAETHGGFFGENTTRLLGLSQSKCLPKTKNAPPLAISKIQSSYARDCHDSSSQRTNSHTIRTGNPSHTDQALRGFHMTIPASHFSQLTTLPTNPLKLHRRPTSPADETRLQYLVQVSMGSSMPNLEVLDLQRSRPTLRSWFHSCQTYAQPNSTVETLETSKKKSVSRPLEENESSNLDCHWKRPKRDSNIPKPMNVDEIATLENTTPLDDEAVENLEFSIANLEVLKEELENLNPFA